MRTEDDLRAAYADLADRAPRAERILLRLESPARRPRSRRGWVLALAALILVTAVAVPLVVRSREAEPTGARRAGYWAMVGQITVPSGWQLGQRAIRGDRESTVVSRGDDRCTVVLYGPGAQPSMLPTGAPRTEGGFTGVWLAQQTPEPSRLQWRYAEDAWAMVECDWTNAGDASAVSFALARSLRVDVPYDIELPFRLRRLPPGYAVQTVASGRTLPWSAGVVLAAPGRPSIGVGTVPEPFEEAGPGMPGVELREINGRPVTIREDQRALQIMTIGGYVQVSSSGGGGQSWQPGELDALLDVAESLDLVDLDDPAAYVPAREAFP